MVLSRRHVLGLVTATAVAGCSSGESGDESGPDGGDDPSDGPGTDSGGDPSVGPGTDSGGDPSDGPGTDSGGDGEDSGETALTGSCASLFGDTMQQYDTGDRGMVATFSYPMGGDVVFEQSDGVDHLTSLGYGKGELSSLHDVTVSERGPLTDTGDATEAYAFDDSYESGTVTTYGGRERPAAIRRTGDESVTYLFRVEEGDGFYEFSVQTALGEGDPCPDTYESVTRGIAESFEPVAREGSRSDGPRRRRLTPRARRGV